MINPQKRAHIDYVSHYLKTIAHPARITILCVLKEGEHTVQALEHAVGTSQSGMSTHLRIMRDKDMLTTRRDGHQIYYSIKDTRLLELLQLLQTLYCPEE